MIFAELPLAEVAGAMLAHSLELGGKRHPKGTPLSAELVAAARAEGLEQLWVARLEPGDVPEDEAAAAIAAKLQGEGVRAAAPAHGRVNLHATADGLLHFDPAAIGRSNAASDAVGVSTLPPHTPVSAGDLVATIKLIPYALPGQELTALLEPPMPPLAVRGWRPELRALLVQTQLAATSPRMLAKTAEVTAARLARLGVALAEAPLLPHAVAPLADALRASDAQLLLVAGATATSDRRDVIPAAIEAAGGTVLRVGMPVDPGNLLVLGRIGEALVIGLPGCARSPRRNGLDLVLERWAAGLELSAVDIAAMGVGGLLEESGRPVPWAWGG